MNLDCRYALQQGRVDKPEQTRDTDSADLRLDWRKRGNALSSGALFWLGDGRQPVRTVYQDPVVIGHVTAVRRTFSSASQRYPVGPFNFFVPEQQALGKIVMHTMEGEYGHELDTISYYDFKERLNSAPLKDSQSVQQSLETLREARSARGIVGRERLAEAQRHLVELLSYLEDQEGYTLFHGARLTCSGY